MPECDSAGTLTPSGEEDGACDDDGDAGTDATRVSSPSPPPPPPPPPPPSDLRLGNASVTLCPRVESETRDMVKAAASPPPPPPPAPAAATQPIACGQLVATAHHVVASAIQYWVNYGQTVRRGGGQRAKQGTKGQTAG
jgi:hypothetical protein